MLTSDSLINEQVQELQYCGFGNISQYGNEMMYYS